MKSRVLLMSADGMTGVLVARLHSRRRVRHLSFGDAHEALAWCMEREVVFIWTPAGQAAAPIWN